MMIRYRTFSAILLTLVCFAPSAQATVFWDDEMESGSSGYGIVAGAMSYDASVKFSGNGSVRLDYPSLCYPDSNAQTNCGGFMDRTFTPTGTFYRRFYIRLSAGFTVSDVFTKLMRSDTTGPTSNWWVLGCCGSKQLLVADQNVPAIGTTMNYYTNFTMKDATWYCVETLEQLNTPGAANGVQQAWVDGVQVMNKTDIQYRQAGDTSLYNNNRLYRQTGLGSIWYDRVAVGDTRIGCVGGAPPPPPPSDTQAPSIPGSLSAQAASSSQINLTWSASSDNVGVTGYRIFRAGTQIATTAGTSYSNTGLSASTAYSYTVAAYDAAGNASAQSSVASATTQASAPPPPAPPGLVSNLAVPQGGTNGVTLSFTEVDDGTGQPAKYDIRFQSPVLNWGSASSVIQGTCATPLTGAQIGATKTCTVLGLSPSTDYQFQLVPFRGTMNVDAVFGPVSNVASGRTSAATPPPVAGAQIFADDFESGNLSLWQDGVNPLIHSVISDPTGGGHGKVLEMKFLLSRSGDGGWLTRFFMPGYNEAYVDFDVYFPNDWTSFTKLMAFYGARTDNQWSAMGQAGKCPTGSDFFTAMTVIDRYNGDPEPFRFYTYYPAMARESDGVTCWGRYGPSATSMVRPALGAWNRLRLYVKLNTLGQSDGLERLYLNGNMFSEWTGLSFGDTNVLKLNSIQITGSAATPKDQILYFDNIKVVQGSPGGAPPADVLPPAKPRNMRVQ